MSRSASSDTRIYKRNWRGLRHRVVPDQVPSRVSLKPPRWTTLIILVFGAVWLAFTLPQLAQVDLSSAPALVFVALFPLIGQVWIALALPVQAVLLVRFCYLGWLQSGIALALYYLIPFLFSVGLHILISGGRAA